MHWFCCSAKTALRLASWVFNWSKVIDCMAKIHRRKRTRSNETSGRWTFIRKNCQTFQYVEISAYTRTEKCMEDRVGIEPTHRELKAPWITTCLPVHKHVGESGRVRTDVRRGLRARRYTCSATDPCQQGTEGGSSIQIVGWLCQSCERPSKHPGGNPSA